MAFDPNDPQLSPEMAGLLLRLDGLTGRLERAVEVLEEMVGDEQVTSEQEKVK